ncbi:MAG: redoxin domain-containing protein [Methylacidiphilales bacterium]|nr:redoxin domain-containing protein [Candidatus Methylacidiphilales bacterium]
MKKCHSLIFWARLETITVFAVGAILFYSVGAWADEENGRLTHDVMVGASHNIQLKTDQIVRILKNSGGTVVIMAQLPDGSSGIYQIDAAAVEIIAPSVTPPPPIVTTPVNTNAAPVNPVASMPAAPTNPPTPQLAATPAATTTPANNTPRAALNSSNPGQQAAGFAANLQGHLVVQEDGQVKDFDASTLQGVKYWAIYFSASWCPDCRAFTPDLVRFYKEFKPDHPNFELILVCHDKTEEAMLNYLKTDGMTWPAVRYKDHWDPKLMVLKYAAKGIPNLVLVDENGEVLSSTYDGTKELGPKKVLDDIKQLVPAPTL